MLGKLESEARYFSSAVRLRSGMFIDGKTMRLILPGIEEEYPLKIIKIPGIHNIENVMAAVLIARSCGCPRESIIATIEKFTGIAHRIEFVNVKRGVRFYDDSKGTNVGAVARALESFSAPVILLLGGRDKGGDFENLSALIRKGVKGIVLFGESRQVIGSKIGGMAETAMASTLKEAVGIAYGQADPGDIVLLSPGCTSFDEFTSYADRGSHFRQWVEEL